MAPGSPVPGLSADRLCELTGLTDRRHRQLAKEGYFPPPYRGQYQASATLKGLFRYFQEQLHKRDDSIKLEEKLLKRAKREMAEEELAEFRRQYVLKSEIGPALRNISLHQKAVLQRKLENELAPNLAGRSVPEILDRIRAVVDEICAIFREQTAEWLQDDPDLPLPEPPPRP